MYYKTMETRLFSAGWSIIDESHEREPNEPGRLVPHYVKFAPPPESPAEMIEITADSTKTGKPGRILKIWQGGRPCRV